MKVTRNRFEEALHKHLGFLADRGFGPPVIEERDDEFFARYANPDGEDVMIRCAEEVDFLEVDLADVPVAEEKGSGAWTEERFETLFAEESAELKERLA